MLDTRHGKRDGGGRVISRVSRLRPNILLKTLAIKALGEVRQLKHLLNIHRT